MGKVNWEYSNLGIFAFNNLQLKQKDMNSDQSHQFCKNQPRFIYKGRMCIPWTCFVNIQLKKRKSIFSFKTVIVTFYKF